jgi:hypothetical protein
MLDEFLTPAGRSFGDDVRDFAKRACAVDLREKVEGGHEHSTEPES